MRNHSKADRVALTGALALGWMFLSAAPAFADRIIAMVDERGRKVYINTGERGAEPARFRSSSRSSSGRLDPGEIHPYIEDAARRTAVDPELVHAIIQVESDYNPNAVSRKGALGLMQLIPATAQRFGVENTFDPRQNIEGGVNYLRYLLDLFNGDLALSLAAYNAGENAVRRHQGVPPYSETRQYVRKVTSLYGNGSGPRQSAKSSAPPRNTICRSVDENGVLHFTNCTAF
jgi:soluble lytic murein transglycosylase-like protein